MAGSGTALITVVVTDNGSTANGGVNTFTRTFAINVTPVDQAPTLAALSNATINENATTQTVNLTGIGAGAGDTNQFLTVVATSSNPNLIPNPTIAYTSANATGTLTYAPTPDTSTPTGQPVTITVTVMDNGGTANSGVNTFQRTFTVTVNPVNQPPTIGPLNNVVIQENSGAAVRPAHRHHLRPRRPGADPERLRHQQQPDADPEPDRHLLQPQSRRAGSSSRRQPTPAAPRRSPSSCRTTAAPPAAARPRRPRPSW